MKASLSLKMPESYASPPFLRHLAPQFIRFGGQLAAVAYGMQAVKATCRSRAVGDAPSVTHVKLVLASSTKLRRGDPAVRNGTDTYLVIALHDLTKDGFEVYPTAIPSRWLRPMRSTRRDSGRLHTCRLRCQYIAVARASNHEAAEYRVRILQGT